MSREAGFDQLFDQFIQMIVTQRAYESNSKVVQAADQMLQNVNNMSR